MTEAPKKIDKVESSEKKGFDMQNFIQQVGKFTQKVNSLSKAVDFTLYEMMPKIFKDKIGEAYEASKKQLDFIMAHLI